MALASAGLSVAAARAGEMAAATAALMVTAAVVTSGSKGGNDDDCGDARLRRWQWRPAEMTAAGRLAAAGD